MWLRTTLFVVEGHWGEGTRADLFITAYHTASSPPEPADIGVSTWQRAPDLALPCRIKTSTNYQVARLAKIEARGRGYSEMVLLNQHGRVAEALGTCILMVRDGCVVTPPPWEGALESITVDLVEQLCKSLCIGFVRRPIERSELAVADEIALAGTLAEVTRVQTLEGVPLPESRITEALQRAYVAVVEGRDRSIDAGLSSRRPPEANDQPILVRPLVARDAPVAGAVPQPVVGALSR
jgi:branched-chain amino acid aminotransferase